MKASNFNKNFNAKLKATLKKESPGLIAPYLKHPKADEDTITAIIEFAVKNAEDDLLQQCLDHPACGENIGDYISYILTDEDLYISDEIFKIIISYAIKTKNLNLLDKCSDHLDTPDEMLANIFEYAVEMQPSRIISSEESQALKSKCANHQMAGDETFAKMVSDTSSNNTSLFSKYLAHPKVGDQTLAAIAYHAKTTSTELIKQCLEHPKAGDKTLAQYVSAIYMHQGVFALELNDCLNHPKASNQTLVAIVTIAVNLRIHKLLADCLNHPSIGDLTLTAINKLIDNTDDDTTLSIITKYALENENYELFEKCLFHTKVNFETCEVLIEYI